jgi:F-type H+-transporting ATPase subunit a
MLPYGAPIGLMLFLPLVEIFSQLIRPLTLTIRFATNISAGHIMLLIFSYFTYLSAPLAPILYIVVFILIVIEIFIAFLQAYIFLTLLGLYLNETIE